MDSETFVCLAFMTLMSVPFAILGQGICRGNRRRRRLLAALTVLFIVAYNGLFRQSPLLLKVFPDRNAIFWTNWLMPATGFLIGVIWEELESKPWRRNLGCTCFFMTSIQLSFGFLGGYMPECRDVWTDGVCIQTSNSSCAAAASTTLLGFYGIRTSEAEMAKICYTRSDGTYWHGTYRGLKIMTEREGLDVEVIDGTLRDLKPNEKGPLLLKVGMPLSGFQDPRYEYEWGWTPGISHAVVLFGFLENGNADIGDPSVGREEWKPESLKKLWSGHAYRLVKTNPDDDKPIENHIPEIIKDKENKINEKFRSLEDFSEEDPDSELQEPEENGEDAATAEPVPPTPEKIP